LTNISLYNIEAFLEVSNLEQSEFSLTF